MASTTRSSNGRSKQAGTRTAANNRSATNRSAAATRSAASRTQGSNGSSATRRSRGAANRGGANRGGANRGGANRGGANRGGANRGGANRGGASRGSSNRVTTKVARATNAIGSAAKKAKTPLLAGGAAAAGLATGTALGALLRGSRRPRVLGVPMPRGDEMKAGATKVARAGRWLYDMETDLRLLREHAEHSRRQSPIEVLLSGLTSRRLPRHH